jgi:hypothetical protein
MKTKFSLLLLLIFLLNSCKEPPPIEINCLSGDLSKGVIAFYPFINGNLQDASPLKNHLTNTTSASPSEDRNGNSDCSYYFDNLNKKEFLTTTKSSFLNDLDEFSISLWYLPLDSINYEEIRGLFSRDSVPCCDKMGEWSVSLYECNQAVFAYDNAVWALSDMNECEDIVNESINKWQHVVGVKKNDEYKIYYNSILKSSKTGNSGSTNDLAEDKGDVFVGFDFTGSIDDIIIYDRELSANEVLKLYEMEPCCE